MQNPNDISENLIDIERVIASKNLALLRVIPGFVIRYLKRIVHQDAVNGYIYRNREKVGLAFVDAILGEFGADIQVKSHEAQGTSNQQPATSNQQPATSNQQPATSNQQPATRI